MKDGESESLFRDASERLCFEIFDVNADSYPSLCQIIAKQFDLKPANDLVVGLDAMFHEYISDELAIELGWDIWSGFIVVAKHPESESLVREIAAFLSAT